MIIPMLSCFEHGVKYYEELPHAGDLYDEIGFSSEFESRFKGDEEWVASSGGESGHVERGSDLFSSSGDASSSLEFSAVMVVRCESTESCDL